MKKRLKYITAILLSVVVIVSVSCGDDDDDPTPQEEKVVYTLDPVSDPAISGTATFTRQSDGNTMISIKLNGTMEGDSHPSHIHANAASEGGGILIDLTNVDGATGMSETLVTELNDGTAITYQELINFDGYINVHKSATELSTLVAQGDIGSNASGSSGNGGNGNGY